MSRCLRQISNWELLVGVLLVEQISRASWINLSFNSNGENWLASDFCSARLVFNLGASVMA